MPWSGDTYTFEPWVPFENFFNSLEATPDYSAFDIPSVTDVLQAFQAVIAGGLVDFDPITAGSPFCPGTCDIPEALTYPALVQDVSNLMPGNPIITEWLNALRRPRRRPGINYNGPTEAQIPAPSSSCSRDIGTSATRTRPPGPDPITPILRRSSISCGRISASHPVRALTPVEPPLLRRADLIPAS